MATEAELTAYAPTLNMPPSIALVLSSANAYIADQIGTKTVYKANERTNAECAYALAILSDGLAQKKAEATGTVKLEDRGEVVVPKDAAQTLRGQADHWRNRANAHLVAALTDPASTEPGAGAPWWLR
jgi:hypothetical protein